MYPSSSADAISLSTFPKTGKRGVPQQFPRRLYQMIEKESKVPNDEAFKHMKEIICWSETGHEFIIKDIAVFSTATLPRYFRTSKFTSFQRNLNLYGFSKVRTGSNDEVYSHPSFLRGRPELLSRLKKSPVTHSRKAEKCASKNTITRENSQATTANYIENYRSVSPCSSPDIYSSFHPGVVDVRASLSNEKNRWKAHQNLVTHITGYQYSDSLDVSLFTNCDGLSKLRLLALATALAECHNDVPNMSA